jgi:hypothetical protein
MDTLDGGQARFTSEKFLHHGLLQIAGLRKALL